MKRLRMRALWIAVLVTACGGKKEQATPEAKAPANVPTPGPTVDAAVAAFGAPPTPATACGNRASRLDKRLTELAAAMPGFMPTMTPAVHTPESAAAKAFDTRGFVVAVTKDSKMFGHGQAFAAVKNVGEWLSAMDKTALEKWVMGGGSGKNAKFPLYIWADRETPADTVAALVAEADANGSHWVHRLLVAGKGTVTAAATPSTSVAAVAANLPASEPEATTYLATQLKAAMGGCAALITPLATSSLAGVPAKEAEKLVADLPRGLISCECKIPDPDLFEWAMDGWFGAWAPSLAYIDMPKLAKGDKQPIAKLVK